MRIKGIYKYPGYDSYYHFSEWASKNGVEINPRNNTFTIAMKRKEGKRYKLSKYRVTFYNNGCGDPSCCGDNFVVSFERK